MLYTCGILWLKPLASECPFHALLVGHFVSDDHRVASLVTWTGRVVEQGVSILMTHDQK